MAEDTVANIWKQIKLSDLSRQRRQRSPRDGMEVSYSSDDGHVVVPPQTYPLETPAIDAKSHADVNKEQRDSDSRVHVWSQCLVIERDLLLERQGQLCNDLGHVCRHGVDRLSSNRYGLDIVMQLHRKGDDCLGALSVVFQEGQH